MPPKPSRRRHGGRVTPVPKQAATSSSNISSGVPPVASSSVKMEAGRPKVQDHQQGAGGGEGSGRKKRVPLAKETASHFIVKRLWSEDELLERLQSLGTKATLPNKLFPSSVEYPLDRLNRDQVVAASRCIGEALALHRLKVEHLSQRLNLSISAGGGVVASELPGVSFSSEEHSFLFVLSRCFNQAIPMQCPPNFESLTDLRHCKRVVESLTALKQYYEGRVAAKSLNTLMELNEWLSSTVTSFHPTSTLAPSSRSAQRIASLVPSSYLVLDGCFVDRWAPAAAISTTKQESPTVGSTPPAAAGVLRCESTGTRGQEEDANGQVSERKAFLAELLRRVSLEGYPPFIRASRVGTGTGRPSTGTGSGQLPDFFSPLEPPRPATGSGGGTLLGKLSSSAVDFSAPRNVPNTPQTASAEHSLLFPSPRLPYPHRFMEPSAALVGVDPTATDLPDCFQPRPEQQELVNEEIMHLLQAHGKASIIEADTETIAYWLRNRRAVGLKEMLQHDEERKAKTITAADIIATPGTATAVPGRKRSRAVDAGNEEERRWRKFAVLVISFTEESTRRALRRSGETSLGLNFFRSEGTALGAAGGGKCPTSKLSSTDRSTAEPLPLCRTSGGLDDRGDGKGKGVMSSSGVLDATFYIAAVLEVERQPLSQAAGTNKEPTATATEPAGSA